MSDPLKLVRISRLLDLYGDLLTKRQVEFCRAYYEEDMTLAEVSESMGVSRQAVHDAIKTAEAALENFERVLKLIDKTPPADDAPDTELAPIEAPKRAPKPNNAVAIRTARELRDLAETARRQGGIYDIQSLVRRLEELADDLDRS